MNKRKLIVSGLLTIAMCSSLAVGGTYALFTSEDSVNIAVTSGKVKVSATLNGATMQSTLGTPMGSATIAADQKSVDLALMAPGDYATVNVNVANESNVNAMYRVSAIVAGDLAPALVVDAKIGAETYQNVGNYVSGWTAIAPTDDPSDVTVTVTFPNGDNAENNKYQNKTANVAIAVEAVQGNAVAISENVTTETELKEVFESNATFKQVKLGGDVTVSQAIATKVGTNTILDLNGYTLSAANTTYALENNGTMTISNGNVSARGVKNFGTMTIKNGTYTALANNGGAAVWNEGTLTIDDGTFVGGNNTSGTYDAGCVNNIGTLTINGGTFKSNSAICSPIISNGTTTINGGNFTSPKTVATIEAGETVINDGTFNCTWDSHSNYALYVGSSANVTINDGEFTSTGTTSLIYVYGKLTVNGGTYEDNNTAQLFVANGNGEIAFGDVEIQSAAQQAVVSVLGNNTTIKAVGTAKLTAGKNGSALYAPANTTLNITGTGSLTAIGNSGADYVAGVSQYSTSNDSSFAGTGGSGIAGEGAIVIDGLNNLVAEGYGVAGFGIGGASKSITIKNTNIAYARGGFVNTKGEYIDADYNKSEPEGGAAIGSLTNGAVILLDNVTIQEAIGGSKSAGIGARYWTSVSVTIKNSTIANVVGGASSAAIGGSRIAKDVAQYANVYISDSTITAQGGYFGAGIGSGYDTRCQGFGKTHIEITGNSVINATGGKYAAGIGTGYHVGGLSGKIESTVTVTAAAGEDWYKAKYTRAQAIGWGVADPAREGKNNTCTFDNQGTILSFPAPAGENN